jgi:5-methylcytosine-specific restriction endonuclease McrA
MTDITECVLIAPRAGACWVKACGIELPPRRRRWCSDDHRNLWGRNHVWSKVRLAAIKRDRAICQRCRAVGGLHYRWTGRSYRGLEINHIVPLRDGSHATSQCRHHLDGVETLCRACHHAVTAAQRREAANANA